MRLQSLAFTLLLALSLSAPTLCSAQPPSNEVSRRIERRIRTDEMVSPLTKIVLSSVRHSGFAHYKWITATFLLDGHNKSEEFLLSDDMRTLINVSTIDLRKDPFREAIRTIHVNGRPVRGNPHAAVSVVVYDDFECPYCAREYQTLFPELLKEYGEKVAIVYKDFPLSEIHEWASHAAVSANCLAAQSHNAYWDFADYVHENQDLVNSQKTTQDRLELLDRIATDKGSRFGLNPTRLASCIKTQDDKAVKESIKEGHSLQIDGTPTIFVNGERLVGATSGQELRAAIDSALQGAAHLASKSASGHMQ